MARSQARLGSARLGAPLRYQGAISAIDDSAGLPISQKSYAVLDVPAGIKVVEHVEASLNVRKLTTPSI